MPKKKQTKNPVFDLPKSVTQITTFSRLFALFLFLLVPIIAFIIGTKYGMIHSYISREEYRNRKQQLKFNYDRRYADDSMPYDE